MSEVDEVIEKVDDLVISEDEVDDLDAVELSDVSFNAEVERKRLQDYLEKSSENTSEILIDVYNRLVEYFEDVSPLESLISTFDDGMIFEKILKLASEFDNDLIDEILTDRDFETEIAWDTLKFLKEVDPFKASKFEKKRKLDFTDFLEFDSHLENLEKQRKIIKKASKKQYPSSEISEILEDEVICSFYNSHIKKISSEAEDLAFKKKMNKLQDFLEAEN